MIQVEGLSKTYRVAEKQPGLAGTLRHFIRRRTRDVTAVQDVFLQIAEIVQSAGADFAFPSTTLYAGSGSDAQEPNRMFKTA